MITETKSYEDVQQMLTIKFYSIVLYSITSLYLAQLTSHRRALRLPFSRVGWGSVLYMSHVCTLVHAWHTKQHQCMYTYIVYVTLFIGVIRELNSSILTSQSPA